jgi:hypothetical protein
MVARAYFGKEKWLADFSMRRMKRKVGITL